jgi:hypothetical protein
MMPDAKWACHISLTTLGESDDGHYDFILSQNKNVVIDNGQSQKF